jgi:hypothetical protein
MLALNDAAVSHDRFLSIILYQILVLQHSAKQYSAFVEQHLDERRRRVEQLDAFVRHRIRLYRQAQNHLHKQTNNKIVCSVL